MCFGEGKFMKFNREVVQMIQNVMKLIWKCLFLNNLHVRATRLSSGFGPLNSVGNENEMNRFICF